MSVKGIRCLGVLVLLMGLNFHVLPEKVGPLAGILKPNMIKVFGGELFVVEGHKIFVYSLPDLKLKTVIGKEGDGPGEYKLDPSRSLIISVGEDGIIAESRFKVVFFSRSGAFQREIRKTNFATLQVLPIGDRYLVYRYITTDSAKNQTWFVLEITDRDLHPLQELHRQEFFSFEDRVFVMPDGINYRVWKDRIYVEKSNQGLIIDGYDFDGERVIRIEKPFVKVAVTQAEKDKALADYLEIPSLRRLRKERGEAAYQGYLTSVKLEYPDTRIPIQDIAITADKMYVRTSTVKDETERYLVLDLEGEDLGEVFLPMAKDPEFLVKIQGDKKYYSFDGGRFYFLKLVSSEEDEEWELHAVNI